MSYRVLEYGRNIREKQTGKKNAEMQQLIDASIFNGRYAVLEILCY